MDRIRLILDSVFLPDDALDKLSSVEGFTRRVINIGKSRPKSITLTLKSGRFKILIVVAHRLDDANWRVACADLNISSLVFGHNGRLIRTPFELALALTRARHFMELVTLQGCHGRLVPGVGANNGFVQYAECSVQIQDPNHLILRGSHTARLPHQQKPALVCWGQSTLFFGTVVEVHFYDKSAQRRMGLVLPEGIDGTRIECKVKKPQRLALEAARTRNFQGSTGEVVKTLSLSTSYDILRHRVGQMTGWGRAPEDALRDLPVAARLLALGLGKSIAKPHAVDKVLSDYRIYCNPCESTLRTVSKRLRAYALATMAPESISMLPDDMEQLNRSDVTDGWVESEYRLFLASSGAPMEPCPEILAAWSQTTFHKRKPTGVDIVGPTAPLNLLPWRKNKNVH